MQNFLFTGFLVVNKEIGKKLAEIQNISVIELPINMIHTLANNCIGEHLDVTLALHRVPYQSLSLKPFEGTIV